MKLIFLLSIVALFSISCSTKRIDNTLLFRKYTTGQIEFFRETAFHKSGKLKKWRNNISVSIEGSLKPGDIELIDTIISEIQPLIHPLKIYKVKDGGNFIIKFPTDTKDLISDSRPAHGLAYTSNYIFKEGIRKAKILISPQCKGLKRQNVFRHEFCHALGFSHPKLTGINYPKWSLSIIPPVTRLELNADDNIEIVNFKFSDLDKAVIRMKYNMDIPNGLLKKDFVLAYETNLKNP